MLVEVATSDSFKNIRSAVYVDALPETDFTAKAPAAVVDKTRQRLEAARADIARIEQRLAAI